MTTYIIIGVIAIVVLFVIVYVKMSIDEKKGADSEFLMENRIRSLMVPAKNLRLAAGAEP